MALSRSEWRSVPMSEDETPIGDARASLVLFFTFWLSGIGLFLRSVWDSPAGERIRVHPIALAWLCGAAAVGLFVLAWRRVRRVLAQRQVYGYTFLISPGFSYSVHAVFFGMIFGFFLAHAYRRARTSRTR
jgi:glucan phosphoethanolaminetransferase (alkaline phosphatase superfamily)